ncbi:hypothetical protein EZL74_07380 [Flavobacterium silvisoli]|uniref:Uncharacterized protein n=1 Tax=Flavobacterium silvisoli TaxID=2529433 RepID=A0A4Q9YZ18_9FLAO|nr:hypothetical protein [Flavobacterium silvisoli]TBX69193.1 hypothetical protein EZL74_07380 [Flavobacterium silvisoli]
MKHFLSFFLLIVTLTVQGQTKQNQNFTSYLPKGYLLIDTVYGDVNNDGIQDCLLLIKGTDKSKVVLDDYGKKADRNRRGLIVLIKQQGMYAEAVKNYNCFSSENEDGGVYMPPELSIEIKNGKLYISFGHGRYGYWRYTFRFNHSDFELIGYDSGDRSSFLSEYVTFDETSINFITRKKLVKKVINVTQDGKEVYKETRQNIKANKLIRLSAIQDFDELETDNP